MQRRSLPKRLSGAVRLAVAVCVAAALLVAVLDRRGRVRCAMDGALHWVACCEAARWADGVAFDEPDCCEYQAQSDLAPAAPALGRVGVVAAALWQAALPPPAPAWPSPPRALAPRAASHGSRAPPARAGPAPPPLARRLARLARLLSLRPRFVGSPHPPAPSPASGEGEHRGSEAGYGRVRGSVIVWKFFINLFCSPSPPAGEGAGG